MNRYLEKIANTYALSKEAGVAVDLATNVASKAWNGVKAVGNQVHLATGGAYINYAHDKLGIKGIGRLSEFGSSAKARERLGKAYQKIPARKMATEAVRQKMDNQFHQDMVGLRKQTTKSRLAVGAMVATPFAAKALKDHVDKKREEAMYSYPTYY